jgi:hypothetical protein
LAIAVALCVVDIMVLPLAERWGEAFLHKALGFVLVLAYLWAAGQSVADARAQALGIVGRLDSIREWLWLVSDRSRHRPAPVSL